MICWFMNSVSPWLLNNIVPALLSAIVAAGLALWVFRQQGISRDESLRKRLTSALIADIEFLRERYMLTHGGKLEATPTDRLLCEYSVIDQDYFTVYHSMCEHIGVFNEDLVREIIKFYTLAKAVVDALKLQSSLLLKMEAHQLAAVNNDPAEVIRFESLARAVAVQALNYQEHAVRPTHHRILAQAEVVLRHLRETSND